MQATGMVCTEAPLRPRTRGEGINWSLPRRGSVSGPGACGSKSKYQYMHPQHLQFPVSVNVRPVPAGPGAEFSNGANTGSPRRASASPMAGPYPVINNNNRSSSNCQVPRGRSNSLSLAGVNSVASLPRSSSTSALTSHYYNQQPPLLPAPQFTSRRSVSFGPPVANSSRPRRHSFQSFPPRSYRQYHARRHKSAQSLPPTIHEMESDNGLKRRDTTKGPPLRILSLGTFPVPLFFPLQRPCARLRSASMVPGVPARCRVATPRRTLCCRSPHTRRTRAPTPSCRAS